MSDTTSKIMIFTDTKECRACLGKIYGDGNSSDLFHAWDPPWFGMGISIAEDLTKITNVQITPSDSHSKSICTECRDRLQDAISFVSMVQNRDLILRTRQIENETASWPKPIQVDKGQVISTMDLSVQVKQEILSDNECEMLEAYSEQDEPKLEIKIEPEEMTLATHSVPEEMTHSVSQSNLPPTVEVDCPATMLNTAGMTLRPISLESVEDEKIQLAKDEPMSEEDIDSAASDDDSMPNDCMLCMKSFNTVKVLKAHVIAAHSYDTIIASQVYKEKEHVCKTCQQSFCTRTDLYVHETCHSKFECCVCDEKFESFPELTKHRSKQCEQAAVMPRLNTLEDVRRPLYLISDKNPSQSENCTMKTDDPDQLIDSKSTEHSHSIKTQITPECSGNEDVKLEKTEHLCDKESNIKKEDIENETKKCLLQPDLPSAKTCDTTNNTCLLTKDIDRDADNQISVGNLPTLHGHELTKKLQDFSDDDNETKTSEDFSVEEQIRSIVGESYIDDSNHDKKAQDLKDKAIKSQELTKSSISGLLSDIKPQEPEQPLEIPQVIDLTKSSISESIFDSKLQEPEQPLDNVSQDNEVTKSSIIESLSDSKNQGHSLTKSEEIKIDYEPDENKFTEDIANERTLTNKPGENIQQ